MGPMHDHVDSMFYNTTGNHPTSSTKTSVKHLYKTEYCHNWLELGECRYGLKCCYAHGDGELRQIYRHCLYKTQICRAYHVYGSCLYGHRCSFIHDDDKETRPRLNSFATRDQYVPSGQIWHSKLGLKLGHSVFNLQSLPPTSSLAGDWSYPLLQSTFYSGDIASNNIGSSRTSSSDHSSMAPLL